MGNKTVTDRRCEQITKHQELVNWIRDMVNEGHSSGEIASKLCVPESIVRSVKNQIGM